MENRTDHKQLPARPEDVADVMLEETASSTKLLRFKKGQYLIGDDEIELGHEYVAYAFDAMRGFVRWIDGKPAEQRMGRIRDRFDLQREDLPANEDWKPQMVLPLEDLESGAFVAFVSGSVGGKIGINELINAVARAVKDKRGTDTPVIRLAVGSFPSKAFGEVDRPIFEIVNEPVEVIPKKSTEADFNDNVPF
jgi:hypothetical protein